MRAVSQFAALVRRSVCHFTRACAFVSLLRVVSTRRFGDCDAPVRRTDCHMCWSLCTSPQASITGATGTRPHPRVLADDPAASLLHNLVEMDWIAFMLDVWDVRSQTSLQLMCTLMPWVVLNVGAVIAIVTTRIQSLELVSVERNGYAKITVGEIVPSPPVLLGISPQLVKDTVV
jgi:hypothetical protein